MKTTASPAWQDSIRAFSHPRVITMLFLGFSAGIPILLIFSSLSLWLREADVSRSTVTFFSWAALGYSFKFVWSPLIDKLPIPALTNLIGRRRAWLLVTQFAVILSILWMSMIDPALGQSSLRWMAIAVVMLGFSSASQDIVIDAYRIESADKSLQAMMSSTYIAGYRIGMLIAGAGALFLADGFGTNMEAYNANAWQWAYRIIAASMLIGVLTTLLIPEPIQTSNRQTLNKQQSLSLVVLFISVVMAFVAMYFLTQSISDNKAMLRDLLGNKALASILIETSRLLLALGAAFTVAKLLTQFKIIDTELVQTSYIEPLSDFFSRYKVSLALLLLALISVYRLSDIVLGVISNVFYQDMGYTKTQIASIVKSFGLGMTIAGGFLGGILSVRFGVIRILLLGAILGAATNILFMLIAQGNPSQWALIAVISADNLSAGLASAAFIAFLSSLTNIQFTATQYAIFSSLMTLLPKILGGYSGSIVDSIGYSQFFLITALLGVPAILLVIVAGKRLNLKPVQFKQTA